MFWGVLSVLLVTSGASSEAVETQPEGLFVNQIVIDPKDSKTLYAVTVFSIGLLKSTDGGKNWTQIHQGLKSLSFTQIVIDPADSNHLYLADGCSGLYTSRNGGRTWVEMNDGLQNTEIGKLVLDAAEAGSAYAATTRGVYKAEDGGKRWLPFNQGDTFTNGFDFLGLIALPTHPTTLYLASKLGLYTRQVGDAGWISTGESFAGKQISALAYDSRNQRLYAAVFRRGVLETLHEGGLFASEDGGKHWTRLGEGLEQDWIRAILIDPSDPKTIYVGTSNRGVIKSGDAGKSWKETNIGIESRDIRSLVMDPHDSKMLYAGSYGRWIFQSRNAGATWSPLPIGPHQTSAQILVSLNQEDEIVRSNSKTKVTPPAAFKKCNTCHGWTDPLINMAPHGLWMVPVNRRDWGSAVKRMSADAGLTPDEEKSITDFLQAYSARAAK